MARPLSWLIVLTAISVPAQASEDLAGTYVHVYYSDAGLCYDADQKAGLQVDYGAEPYEWTYASTTIQPFLGSAFQFTSDDGVQAYDGYYKDTGYSVDWTTSSEEDLSSGSTLESRYVWDMGDLEVVKTETWDAEGLAIFVKFEVTNIGTSDLTDFTYEHVIDPVDSSSSTRSSNTRNDDIDLDGDGQSEWAQSQGRSTTTKTNNYTMGFGLCDPRIEAVGFNAGTEVSVAAISLEDDPEGSTSNYQIIYQHAETTLAVGDTQMFGFVIAFGADASAAQDAYAAAQPGCLDLDGDGFENDLGDGSDCDDEDATVNPGATEIWYDGIDQDCARDDDYDQDVDGYVADEYVGLTTTDPGTGDDISGTGDAPSGDCDDTESDANPAADDAWYDGIDSNCDGVDDYDQDGDGYVPDEYVGLETTEPDGDAIRGTGNLPDGDCDDTDEDIHPGADDAWYDGIDSDCAGNDDYDQDGDGVPLDDDGGDGSDCDDTDPDIHPGADDAWYDGIDSDCAEDDDYDQDGDGTVPEEYEGLPTTDGAGDPIDGTGDLPGGDCDDTDPTVIDCPPEVPYYKGGGGCTCATGAETPSSAGIFGLMVLAGALWRRRRTD